jgi:hypothetical protein
MTDTLSSSPAQTTTTVRPARRWFALLGGAVAWFVHLIGIYAISEFGCVAGLDELRLSSVSVVALLLLTASVVPLIVAVAAALVGYRDVRRDQRQAHERAPETWLSRAGWLFSGLFAVIVAVQSIPALFYLAGC